METINIKPEYLEEIKGILEKYIPGVEVWAFGSRLGDFCHDGSDLDLVLKYRDNIPVPLEKIQILKESFSESNIPFLIDVIDWARIPDSFHDEILKGYVIIQDSKPGR